MAKSSTKRAAPRRAGGNTGKGEGRLVRKQVLLTAGQDRWLKRRAKETGEAESAIIRAALDRAAGIGDAGGDDWRERLRALSGSIPDTEHLEQTIKENRRRWGERLDKIRRDLSGDD